ncbi:hypothetical protein Vretimale_5811 [Volvox reticuliferus]|uniref:GCK domain-containing protein n=1 Tax=Volvox reticuliferus TaxID=1737510 RepID=A0A8J4G6A0_9CHLO|nr:hypothetical protein Vretifemale_5710 [Volvox reticuliferus]GIM00921.1 hypothetical protein Vretimale_5811 [Volvox reticuliferus]
MEPGGEPLSNPADVVATNGADGEDEEECGWCRWMKAGGCKAEFQVWLDCVDAVKAAGRDDVESCASIMGPLWECMERHKDYYAPQLNSLAERRKGGGTEEGDLEDDDEIRGEEPSSQEGVVAEKGDAGVRQEEGTDAGEGKGGSVVKGVK